MGEGIFCVLMKTGVLPMGRVGRGAGAGGDEGGLVWRWLLWLLWLLWLCKGWLKFVSLYKGLVV